MSLRGRLVIDRLKSALGSYVTLPCPPYGQPGYWEDCYKSLGPNDNSFEWGNHGYRDLQMYEYRLLPYNLVHVVPCPNSTSLTKPSVRLPNRTQTSLGETLGVYPLAPTDEPIVLLGCGNSQLGQDMCAAGYRGPLLHVDIASRVLEAMAQKCADQQRQGHMQFIQDDATQLSAIPDKSVQAVLDKGLMDALYCANEYEQCQQVMQAVHRVLVPGGIFVLLSFSRPEFLLTQLLPLLVQRPPGKMSSWDLQVRQLDYIFLYQWRKTQAETVMLRRPKPHGGHTR